MTYFQLPLSASRLLTGGTRLFVSGDSGLERLVIETAKQVPLELAGLAGPKAKPTILQERVNSTTGVIRAFLPYQRSMGPDVVSISALRGSGTKRAFTLKAVRPGMAMLLANDGNDPAPLIVVAGHFLNHPECNIDLIANVFRTSDAAKMQVLTRLLFNDPDNLFNESSVANERKWGPLACGTVSKVGASAIFHEVDYTYHPYARAIHGMETADARANLKRKDVKYDESRLKHGCKAIQQRLAKGIPSLVGLVYNPSGVVRANGTLRETGPGGHTVPIVGCNADATKFLYIDVFPNGSKLKYTGGYAGQDLFPKECNFLGMFELVKDDARGCFVLCSRETARGDAFSGNEFLEVVSGPL